MAQDQGLPTVPSSQPWAPRKTARPSKIHTLVANLDALGRFGGANDILRLDVMNTSVIKSTEYIAALRTELTDAGPAKRAVALLNQRVLFPHRGKATLTSGQLELADWDDKGAITISPTSVRRVTRQFDNQYGAFVGGASAKWGAPIIIELKDGTVVYALFNHRAFLEKTDNPEWEDALLGWLT